MIRRWRERAILLGSDAGMAVSEYAVGCVAVCGLGYGFWQLLTSDRVYRLLDRLIREGWLTMHVLIGA